MYGPVASILRIMMCWFVASAANYWGRAQTTSQAPLSSDRVTFYTDPNFKGNALTVEAGASVENLARLLRPDQKPWVFAISSVKIEGAAQATVFGAAGFEGDRLEITRDISDLYSVARGREPGATWDRAIASVNVTGPNRVLASPPPAVRYAEPPSTVVVMPTPAPPPPMVLREVRPRMDRRTAELLVHRAYRDVLGRSPDPQGLRTYRDRLLNDGWSEQQLRHDLQRSQEGRSMDPDEVVRRAYREVLGREPDAQGLVHYRAKVRSGWTLAQVRDDLRRSQEARGNSNRDAIIRAYRDVLGREPDAAGLAHYERQMREKRWTERDVRENLMKSDEYRQRKLRR
jgi:hypothetical protein